MDPTIALPLMTAALELKVILKYYLLTLSGKIAKIS